MVKVETENRKLRFRNCEFAIVQCRFMDFEFPILETDFVLSEFEFEVFTL